MDENENPLRSGADALPGNKDDGTSDAIPDDSSARQITLGRAAVPPDLNDPDRRAGWGLPRDETKPGDYMVELNVSHQDGLRAANSRFLKLFARVAGDERQPTRVGQTYYHCRVSVEEWRKLIDLDENLSESELGTGQAAGGGAGAGAAGEPADKNERGTDGKIRVDRRAIYRLWPDFPIKPLINHSMATIKADAALLSYAASGKGIVWAVMDSGIDADHPHFGGMGKGRDHTLRAPSVINLHRDFTKPGLPDPDADPSFSDAQRTAYLDDHRRGALTDNYHHGTHVAGIIAGGLTKERLELVDCRVFERKFSRDDRDRELPSTLEERTSEVDDPTQLHGVAPLCRLISLKVLDDRGFGRTSNVLRALDYIRLSLNANPKTMLVHGANLSIGYEFDAQLFACGQSPICVEVDRLVQAGVVVVAAAGNTGYGTIAADQRRNARAGLSNTINDPGNAALAITVGATHRDMPHTYGVSYFSSKGPTGDGRLKPDLVAPGERITSCAAGTNLQFIETQLRLQAKPPMASPEPPAPVVEPAAAGAPAPAPIPAPPPARPTAAYIDESGTSMAAPHVSGAIAAFLSIRREFIGKPLEVKRIFLDSATSLGRERYFEGNGLLDSMRAIQSV